MNIQILLILLLCCIISTIILIFVSKSLKKKLNIAATEKKELEELRKGELRNYFKEEWNQEKERLDKEISNFNQQIELNRQLSFQSYESQIKEEKLKIENLQNQLKEKEKRYNEVNQDLDLYKSGKIKEIDSAVAEYEQRKRLEIKQILQQRELQANSDFNNHVDSYIIQKAQMQSEIEEIKAELEVERSKRAAINEEILRQRALEEQQDFYRIQLPNEDLEDIEILRSVSPRLRHPEAINKIIWANYYQKPLAELRKRVAIEGSGVYKITRMKTGEIYIGQAVNVSTRWADHVKSALGVGTLASSQLHRVMKEDGCENFTFELLEKVPKEKLKERESYYIDFYDSKNYGLNTLSGVKI